MKHIRVTLAAVAALTVVTPAIADDWPSRPVRILSTFAAGGAADVLARVIAEHLSTALKQQFFVEARLQFARFWIRRPTGTTSSSSASRIWSSTRCRARTRPTIRSRT
jgi:hypothetical protein